MLLRDGRQLYDSEEFKHHLEQEIEKLRRLLKEAGDTTEIEKTNHLSKLKNTIMSMLKQFIENRNVKLFLAILFGVLAMDYSFRVWIKQSQMQ